MTSKQNMDDKNHNPAGSNQHTQKTGASSSQRQLEQSSGSGQRQQGSNNPEGKNQHSEGTKSSPSGSRQQEQSGGPSRQQGGTHEQHVKAGQPSHKNS